MFVNGWGGKGEVLGVVLVLFASPPVSTSALIAPALPRPRPATHTNMEIHIVSCPTPSGTAWAGVNSEGEQSRRPYVVPNSKAGLAGSSVVASSTGAALRVGRGLRRLATVSGLRWSGL